MESKTHLKKGDIVRIRLIPNDITVTQGMKKYNGAETFVSKVCSKKGFNGLRAVYGYELDGVESDLGVPYTFIREMLFKVELTGEEEDW